MRVLVIEDNVDLAANIVDYLEAGGHLADFAATGGRGLEQAASGDFDALVLDLTLPGMDGIEVCRSLRADGVATPILMLTARDTLIDKLHGFDAGTDDYLVKPFSLEEMLARLMALHRRATSAVERRALRVHDLEFEPDTLRVRRGGCDLRLNPAERRLLLLLMRNAGKVVSHANLERALWGDDPPDSDALRAHIHLLRNAIDRDHDVRLLQTVRGAGYRLTGPDDDV